MKIKKLLPLLVIPALLTGCSDVKTFKPSFEKYEDEVKPTDFAEEISKITVLDILDGHLDRDDHIKESGVGTGDTYSALTVKGTDTFDRKVKYTEKSSETSEIKYDHDKENAIITSKTAEESTYTNVDFASLYINLNDLDHPVKLQLGEATYEGSESHATESSQRIQTDGSTIYALDDNTLKGYSYDEEMFEDWGMTVGDASLGSVATAMYQSFAGTAINALSSELIVEEGEFYIDNNEQLFTIVLEWEDTYTVTETRYEDGLEYDFDTDYDTTITIKVQANLEDSVVAFSEVIETEVTDEDGLDVTAKLESYGQYELNFKKTTVKDVEIDDYVITHRD